jgi:hypothetical protein
MSTLKLKFGNTLDGETKLKGTELIKLMNNLPKTVNECKNICKLLAVNFKCVLCHVEWFCKREYTKQRVFDNKEC